MARQSPQILIPVRTRRRVALSGRHHAGIKEHGNRMQRALLTPPTLRHLSAKKLSLAEFI
ncbi:hypothetical protein MCEMSEM47_01359 [Burkholderiales bacterium]